MATGRKRKESIKNTEINNADAIRVAAVALVNLFFFILIKNIV